MARQSEGKPEAICKEHGWILANQTFADFGVSAFRGKNRLKGDLATFVKLVAEKKLLPNPVLILEQWDRFSRQDIEESEAAVMDLLRAGVAIYITFGNRTFTKSSTKELGHRIEIMVALKAAYEYSANLSKRISEGWNKKKQRLTKDGTAYRAKPPGWLKWNEQTQAYIAIPEKVQSLERLFALALAGHGVRNITKHLNQEGVERIGNYNGNKTKSVRWSNVVVANLLHSTKPMGLNDNLDPPVKMFPEVIKPKVWYAAKALNDSRRTNHYYGRGSGDAKNLFAGVVFCKECGQRMNMHIIKSYDTKRSKNFGSRGGIGARGGKAVHSYLWCGGYVNGSCSSKQIVYGHLQESFFPIMLEPKFRETIIKGVYGSKDADDVIPILKGKIVEAEKRLVRYADDYEKVQSDTLLNLMAKTEAEIKTLRQDIESQITIEIGTTPAGEMYSDLIDLMQPKADGDTAEDWNKPETRVKIRDCIRSLVAKIVVDIASKSYDVFFRASMDKPVHVQCYKEGFRIDGGNFMYFADALERVGDTPKFACII